MANVYSIYLIMLFLLVYVVSTSYGAPDGIRTTLQVDKMFGI